MEHRRGRRWPLDLTVRVTIDHSQTTCPGRILDLSFNGAAIEMTCRGLSTGEIVLIWLPGMRLPVEALTVRTQGSTAGLLWTEYSDRVMSLIEEVIPTPPVLSDIHSA